MNAEQSHAESTLSFLGGILSSLAVRIYLAGITLVFLTVLATDALNPRGRRGASWFDDLTLPLGCISLLVCIIAPFLSSRPVSQRLGWAVLALGGFAVAAVSALIVSTMIFGLPDQD